MESIEASGKSVDEAVQQALTHLGKRREDVEIMVYKSQVAERLVWVVSRHLCVSLYVRLRLSRV